MKKLVMLLVLLLAFQVVFAAGTTETTAPAAAEEQSYRLKWSGMMNASHAWTYAEIEMCKELAELTNGRIIIEPYPSGTLGTQAQGIEMLMTGDLAFITSGPSIFASYVPQTQLFTFPYLFKDVDHVKRIVASPAIQKLFNEEVLNKIGVRTIGWWYYGTRNVTTKNTPAKVPADLSKLKIRALDNPVARDVIIGLGGNPVPVAFNELYFALQTGVVDGQENPITTIYDMKFNEVQKYLIMTQHNVHMGTVHVSEKVWSKFSENDKKLILGLLDKYTAKIEELIVTQTDKYLAEMVAGGLQVVEPDREAFRTKAVDYIMGVYKDDPKWKSILEQVLAIK